MVCVEERKTNNECQALTMLDVFYICYHLISTTICKIGTIGPSSEQKLRFRKANKSSKGIR